MSQVQGESPAVQQQGTNALGLAGFICSLVGVVTGGLLSPVGLILSFIALGRKPQGFAVAGVILGLIGTCGGLVVLALVLLGVIGAGAVAAALVLSEPQRVEMTADSLVLTAAIEGHRSETGVLPDSLQELDLDQALLLDPWENAYRYELDPQRGGYRILSNGPDGTAGTDDDVNIRHVAELWDAREPDGDAAPPQE